MASWQQKEMAEIQRKKDENEKAYHNLKKFGAFKIDFNKKPYFPTITDENENELFTPESMAAGAAIYDKNFKNFRGNKGKRGLPKATVNEFDRVFVNGESVRELCAEETKRMSEADKIAYMKTFVTIKAAERENMIGVYVIGKDNKEQVVPLVSKVKEKRPKVSVTNALSRLFTSDEEKKREKDYRNYLIENGNKSTADLLDDVYSTREDIETSRVKQFKRNEQDSEKLENAVMSADIEPQENDYYDFENRGANLTAALLFNRGYSFDEIFDPKKLSAEKEKAINDLKGMVERNNPKEAAKFLTDFAKNMEKLPALEIDHSNTGDIVRNRREIMGRGPLAANMGGLLKENKTAFKKELFPAFGYDGKVNTLTEKSHPYRVISKSMSPPSGYRKPGDKENLYTTIACTNMRKKAGAMLNRAKSFKDVKFSEAHALYNRVKKINSRLKAAKMDSDTMEECHDAALSARSCLKGFNSGSKNPVFDFKASFGEPSGNKRLARRQTADIGVTHPAPQNEAAAGREPMGRDMQHSAARSMAYTSGARRELSFNDFQTEAPVVRNPVRTASPKVAAGIGRH